LAVFAATVGVTADEFCSDPARADHRADDFGGCRDNWRSIFVLARGPEIRAERGVIRITRIGLVAVIWAVAFGHSSVAS